MPDKPTMLYIYILICVWPMVITQKNLCRRPMNSMYSSRSRRYELQCCPGYIRDWTHPGAIQCMPVCVPPCQNSFCSKPGECLCDSGYTADPVDDRNCLPSCPEGCPNGFCLAPQVCGCNHGYNLLNNTCVPVCTEPCHNGFCKSPENCECNPGYRKSERSICEPYCSVGCNNGFCVGPETCACETAWQLSGINTCAPVCSINCTAGCLAPNECMDPSTEESITDIVSESTTDSTTMNIGAVNYSSVDNLPIAWTATYKETYGARNATAIGSTNSKKVHIIWISVAAFLVLLLIITAVLVGKVCYVERNYHIREPQKVKNDITSSSFNITFSSIAEK